MSLISNEHIFFSSSGGNDVCAQCFSSATFLRVPRPLTDTVAHVPIIEAENAKTFF